MSEKITVRVKPKEENLSLSSDLLTQVKENAEKYGLSLDEYMEEMLTDQLEAEGKTEGSRLIERTKPTDNPDTPNPDPKKKAEGITSEVKKQLDTINKKLDKMYRLTIEEPIERLLSKFNKDEGTGFDINNFVGYAQSHTDLKGNKWDGEALDKLAEKVAIGHRQRTWPKELEKEVGDVAKALELSEAQGKSLYDKVEKNLEVETEEKPWWAD